MKKSWKKVLVTGLSLCMVLGLAACGGGPKEQKNSGEDTAKETVPVAEEKEVEMPEVIRMGIPKAPPSFPLLKMMEDKVLGEGTEIRLDFWDSPEVLIGMVQGGEHDYFASPLPVTAKLFNKGLDIKMTNAVAWGVGTVVTSDPSIKTLEDLRGKEILMPLKSSPVDVFFQYFMDKKGMKAGKDYTLIDSNLVETSNMMVGGQAKYAVMIEPQISAAKVKNPDLVEAIHLEEEWEKIYGEGTSVPGSGLIVSGKFAEEHHDAVVKFEEEYAKATKWVTENVEEAAALGEKYMGLKKENLINAIPKMNLDYKSAQDAKTVLEGYYETINEFDPKMVGGKVPGDDLYFK